MLQNLVSKVRFSPPYRMLSNVNYFAAAELITVMTPSSRYQPAVITVLLWLYVCLILLSQKGYYLSEKKTFYQAKYSVVEMSVPDLRDPATK